jgi:hypothetical protein
VVKRLPGKAYATFVSDTLEASCDVDPVTVDVVLVHHNVAEVNADPQEHAPTLRQG